MVDRVLHCDCGFEARAADENELVATVQRHAREVHDMSLVHDQALLLVRRARVGMDARPAIPPRNRHKEKR